MKKLTEHQLLKIDGGFSFRDLVPKPIKVQPGIPEQPPKLQIM